MARFCIDASVLLTWLLDQHNEGVKEFWLSVSTDDDLVASQLLLPEATSVIRRAVFTKALTPEFGQNAVDRILAISFDLVLDPRQFLRAFGLAAQFQHKKAYDMQYLAAAELSQAELVTRDRGLRHAAAQIGVPVRFLA